MKKFLNEFKDFAMKGNMIDLAIGVVIGGAFSKIVTMIVDCIITPLISLIIILLTGKADTNQLFWYYYSRSFSYWSAYKLCN